MSSRGPCRKYRHTAPRTGLGPGPEAVSWHCWLFGLSFSSRQGSPAGKRQQRSFPFCPSLACLSHPVPPRVSSGHFCRQEAAGLRAQSCVNCKSLIASDLAPAFTWQPGPGTLGAQDTPSCPWVSQGGTSPREVEWSRDKSARSAAICWGPSWPSHLLPGYVILGKLFLSEPVSMPVK